MNRENIEKKD